MPESQSPERISKISLGILPDKGSRRLVVVEYPGNHQPEWSPLFASIGFVAWLSKSLPRPLAPARCREPSP